jgi:hypothetical protein
VDPGVLADVQGLEMEAIGADLEQEGIDVEAGESLAAIVDEARAQDGEVGDQFGSGCIGRERGAGGERDGDVRRAAEAHHDAADEQAYGLKGEAVFKDDLACGAQLREVGVDQFGELEGDGDDARGAGELIEDHL